jgi:FtsZ-binding cell division protein ZapB
MFGKLKYLIWEEETPQKVPNSVSQQVTPIAPSPIAPSPIPETPQNFEYVKVLNEALSAKALREYDYLKYMASVADLATVVADEKTRFSTAYLAVKSLGVTKAKLIETSNHYLAVVEEEHKSFLDTVAGQLKDKVEVNEASIATLEAKLKAKGDEIAKLQEEIASLKTQRDSLSDKVQTWRSKIETTKAAFESACQQTVANIKGNVEKINQYTA